MEGIYIRLNKTNFKSKKIREIYNGNICLDLGSSSGSITLYPRSIEIIENGGLLLQLKQADLNPYLMKMRNILHLEIKRNWIKKLKN